MKKTLGIFYLMWAAVCWGQTPPSDGHWVNVWTDNFNSSWVKSQDIHGFWWAGPSSSDLRWQISHDFEFGNAPQVYLQNNISFDNANGLIITTNKLSSPYTCVPCSSHQVFNYASGNVTRYATYPNNIHYGYIEARITIEKDVFGTWPAFWLWNDNRGSGYNQCSGSYYCTCSETGGNYDYDEIDIFELTPGAIEDCESAGYVNVVQNKNITRTNIHVCDHESCGSTTVRAKNLPIADYTQPHTYGIEWSPSKIIWYIDGNIIRDSPNPEYPNSTGDGDISQYLNLIIGNGLNDNVSYPSVFWSSPNNGSTAYFNSSSYTPADINTTPTHMYVQYVSYWTPNLNAINCSSLSDQTITTSNINSFDNKIDKSYSTSGSIMLPSSKIWRATDYISITGDFDSNGKELYLDVNPCQ